MSEHVIYEELPGFISDKSSRTNPGRVVYGKSSGISSSFHIQYFKDGMWMDDTNMLREVDVLQHALYRAVCELAKVNNKSGWANPYHLKEKLIAEDIIF